MAEECRLCQAPVRVADAAHVMLNAPEAGVRDYYVCPACYEESVEPLFDRTAATDEEDVAPGGESDPGGKAGPEDEASEDVAAPE